jgi:hypothetical protein
MPERDLPKHLICLAISDSVLTCILSELAQRGNDQCSMITCGAIFTAILAVRRDLPEKSLRVLAETARPRVTDGAQRALCDQ